MKNACTTLIAALLVPSLTAADARLWGTWQGTDPEDGFPLRVTFSESGFFSMERPDASFEALFEDVLYGIGLSLDKLDALGFEPPFL